MTYDGQSLPFAPSFKLKKQERSRATRQKRSEKKNEARIARKEKKNCQEQDRIALERSERVYECYKNVQLLSAVKVNILNVVIFKYPLHRETTLH